jgi:predicted Zn finger-like uncharacterized protein
MMIAFNCPHCNRSLRVADDKAGVTGRCPGCGQRFTVPEPMPAFEVVEDECAPPEKPVGFEVVEEAAPVRAVPIDVEPLEAVPAPAEPGVEVPLFEVEPYKPVNGWNPSGVTMMAATAMIGAITLGFLASFIGQFFYLVFIFPVGIGIALGLAIGGAAKFGKVHHPIVAGIVGLFGGVLAMTTVHYFDYQRALDELAKQPAAPPPQFANPRNPRFAQQAAPAPQPPAVQPTFFDYMDAAATAGVTIGKPGQQGINLGYTGSVIYWLLEMVGVAVIVFVVGLAIAAEPFCVGCDVWKQKLKLGAVPHDGVTATAALSSGNLAPLLAEVPAEDGSFVRVTAAVCPKCGTDGVIDVKLEQVVHNAKGEAGASQLAHVSYPGEAMAVFEALCRPEPAPPKKKKK